MSEPNPDVKSARWPVVLIWLLGRLPLPLLYMLADMLFVLFFHLIRFQRDLVVENLGRAFPEQSSQAIRRLAARSYRHAIHILFETIKCLSFSDHELAQRVEIENTELIDSLLHQHRTILAAASHHCNWEWLQMACSARLGVPLAVLYKPLNHRGIDTLLLQMRSRYGSKLIEAKSSLPELVKFARQPGVIAVVADQGPRADEEKYWSRFLHRDTAFFPGLEKLAQLLKAPVVFVRMKRVRRGHYRICFEVLTEPPYRQQSGVIMEPYIRAVEKQIIEAPQDWFWAYKRWKYKKPVYEVRH
jgi:KDO2-lipid IV(A) lauroyltransferase